MSTWLVNAGRQHWLFRAQLFFTYWSNDGMSHWRQLGADRDHEMRSRELTGCVPRFIHFTLYHRPAASACSHDVCLNTAQMRPK